MRWCFHLKLSDVDKKKLAERMELFGYKLFYTDEKTVIVTDVSNNQFQVTWDFIIKLFNNLAYVCDIDIKKKKA